MARKPPFTMELSDEHRAALERIRIKLGARSAAEAVRRMIESEDKPEGLLAKAQRLDAERRLAGQPLGSALNEMQLGPEKPLPGSRLKKPKGGK